VTRRERAELATNEDSRAHEYAATSPEWGAHWRGWLAGYEAALAQAVEPGDRLHAALLARVEELVQGDPPADSPDGRHLKWLAQLVEEYEKARWPIGTTARIRARGEG